MFFDWLSCYQDFDFELPIISDNGYAFFDFVEGELGTIKQSKIKFEGSYSTSISVHVQGNRLVVEGNPSRFGRLDNLVGFSSLDDCFKVYNSILTGLGLPVFTKCTKLGYIDYLNGKAPRVVVDGAILTRLDLTENQFVGGGVCISTYLKALSMLPFRRSRANLYPDGNTVDWKSIQGNATYLYPSVYNKAVELKLHLLPKVKRAFGDASDEYLYVSNLIKYCAENGVTRHEIKIKSAYLIRHNLAFWGLSKHNQLTDLHNEFINLDQKLKVSAMDLRTISQTLLEEEICTSTKAANTTALYAYNWMNGDTFESHKKQVQIHRARLRKIGIDILKPCNLLIFSPVIVKKVTEIHRSNFVAPDFYKHAALPSHLRLIA